MASCIPLGPWKLSLDHKTFPLKAFETFPRGSKIIQPDTYPEFLAHTSTSGESLHTSQIHTLFL